MKYFRSGATCLFALMLLMLSACAGSDRGQTSDLTGNTEMTDAPLVSDTVTTDAPSDTPAAATGESERTASDDTPTIATGRSDATVPDSGEKPETKSVTVAHVHVFAAATCTAPATCTRCGATSGKALGHNYTGVTCTASGSCTRCGAKIGALGHHFVAATCTAPKTCTRCKITSGSALGHIYSGGKCKRCGDTKGPLTPEEAKLFKNKLSDAENAQALAAAREIIRQIEAELPNGTDLERITRAAELVSAEYQKGVHLEKGNYYNTAYGVFVKRESSCAGCCRALGLVLSCMNYRWTHVNENQWTHQWVTVNVNGGTIWADGQVGLAGTGDYPFA